MQRRGAAASAGQFVVAGVTAQLDRRADRPVDDDRVVAAATVSDDALDAAEGLLRALDAIAGPIGHQELDDDRLAAIGIGGVRQAARPDAEALVDDAVGTGAIDAGVDSPVGGVAHEKVQGAIATQLTEHGRVHPYSGEHLRVAQLVDVEVVDVGLHQRPGFVDQHDLERPEADRHEDEGLEPRIQRA
ncbi:MAG: hypothetical protein AW07_04050 [Candidatus Accumulibacter sp. SK-11]|nr:MAG: hypothetical protein AW07_04050 [Candidatus Accumulibacter sp. SK-11]